MTEIDNLNQAIACLKTAKILMEEAFNFDQLNTGQGNELYGENIDRLIAGIKVYLNRQ